MAKFKNILFIINPASGKDEPILNPINEAMKNHEYIEWDIKVTKAFGDAFDFTEKGVYRYDVIAVYGGDGTVHEVINAAIGKDITLALLPGGTGNGFLTGLGIPHDLSKALNTIFEGTPKGVDVAKVDDRYCISRMYTGIEEDLQTSREMKDKFGTFAYAINSFNQMKNVPIVDYKLEIDGEVVKTQASKVYIANSGSTGTYISLGNFDVHDGYLDIFTMNKNIKSLASTANRMWNSNTDKDTLNHWKGKKIKIDAKESQPVWIDGEFYKRTPIEIEVIPSAVKIITK